MEMSPLNKYVLIKVTLLINKTLITTREEFHKTNNPNTHTFPNHTNSQIPPTAKTNQPLNPRTALVHNYIPLTFYHIVGYWL